MTCPRCDGLLVEDWDRESGAFQKCINCGGTMPKFRDEEHKQEWLAKCAATRLANKRAMGTKAITVSKEDIRQSHGSGGIASALDEIDAKIAALQHVRQTLVHAHELVNT